MPEQHNNVFAIDVQTVISKTDCAVQCSLIRALPLSSLDDVNDPTTEHTNDSTTEEEPEAETPEQVDADYQCDNMEESGNER